MLKNKTKIFYDFEATSVSRDSDPISVGLIAITEKSSYQKRNYKLFEDFVHTFKTKFKISDETLNEQGIYKDLEELNPPEIKTFYAEFTDFNIDKCVDWVKENIVNKLQLKEKEIPTDRKITKLPFAELFETDNFTMKNNSSVISLYIKHWLSQFEEIEFWADFDVIDKPMLIDLIADWNIVNSELSGDYKTGLPKHLPNIRYDQFFDLHTLFKINDIDTDINREEFIGNLIKEIPQGNKHNALYDAYVSWKCYEKLKTTD